MEKVVKTLQNVQTISNVFQTIFGSEKWQKYQETDNNEEICVQYCLEKLESIEQFCNDLQELEKEFVQQEEFENILTPFPFIYDASCSKKQNIFTFDLTSSENQQYSESCQNNDEIYESNINQEQNQEQNIQEDQSTYGNSVNTQKIQYSSSLQQKPKLFTSEEDILIIKYYPRKESRNYLYSKLSQEKYQINAHFHSLQRQIKKNGVSTDKFLEIRQNNLRIKRNQHQNIFSPEQQIKILQEYPDKDKRQQLFQELGITEKQIKIKYNNILKDIRKNSQTIQEYIDIKQQYILNNENVKLEEDNFNIMQVQDKKISKQKLFK